MPYLAKLEKAGIPTVIVDFEDQANMVKEEALSSGVPHIRSLHASRTLPGPEDVDNWLDDALNALVTPLTDEEKEGGGIYNPSQPRVLFEGSLEEAEEFYMQETWVPHPVNAPISLYTDGLPIVVPTEERVAEMLKGTSHKPDEILAYQTNKNRVRPSTGDYRHNESGDKGDPILFQPRLFSATVEQVAVNAVMAGCKPEHLPVVLAIAESTCPIGSTHTFGQFLCVSGPIAKEIGMSSGCGMYGPGNRANACIGRAYELIARNLGGAITGVNRMTSIGSPFEGCRCGSENADALPPGWKGLNEEAGYKKDESVIMVLGHVNDGIRGVQFSPGGYRAFQKSGHGGIARRLGLKGVPGPHNWLEYLLPEFWACREGGKTLIMVPEMAQHLYEIGFKSKEEVYEWLWKKSFMTVEEYRHFSWPDFSTNGWLGIEPTSGKHWKELPDDYMVPAAGPDPSAFRIIVGGGDEEVSQQLSGSRSFEASTISIDAWR